MKIQITKNSTDITIDASNVNSLRELRSAIETALHLQGYTKEDIDEVFNREQDAKKGVSRCVTAEDEVSYAKQAKEVSEEIFYGMEKKEPYKDFIVGMSYRCIVDYRLTFQPNKWYQCVESDGISFFFINDFGDKIPFFSKESALESFDVVNPIGILKVEKGGVGVGIVEQVMNGPKVEEQGWFGEDGRYYYPRNGEALVKECKHHKHSMSCFGNVAMIGSMACGNCMFNKGIDNEAGWIKCSKIKEVLGVES